MKAAECYEVLRGRWTDEVVVCSLGVTTYEWWRQTESDRPFYMTSSMGLAASFGLGLALCLPQARVWVLDSDGALAMNLGTLLTEAAEQPPNLTHFVLSNGCYQTIGGHPLVGGRTADYRGMAEAAGVERALRFDDADALAADLDDVVGSDGYTFVVLEVERQEGGTSFTIPYEGPEMKYRFGRHLERQFGLQVFGPRGY